MAEFERIAVTAHRLDVSRETIRLWCLKGYFPGAFRAPEPGSQWRIPKDADPAFIKPTTTTPRRVIRRRKDTT